MKKTFIILLSAVAITFGCSKKKGCTDPISIQYDADAEEDDGSCQYAGTGGNATIAAFPVHHTVPIFSSGSYPDSAFVKFNAKESPGLSAGAYDLVLVGDSGEDHVHIEGLKAGYYWVQMTGFDTAIGKRVIGGTAVKLTSGNGEVDQTVYVTE